MFHLCRKTLMAVALFSAGAHAQTAPKTSSQATDVPSTKVLAIGSRSDEMTPAQRQSIMPKEVPATVRLYLNGKIDQWWVRKDGKGVVFLMNVNTVEQAQELLESLPLGQAHLMKFEYLPLGPLSPLTYLLKDSASTTTP